MVAGLKNLDSLPKITPWL